MPFVKGQSGNPKGRPKLGKSIAGILRNIGNEEVFINDEKPELGKITKLEKILRVAYMEAELGEAWAFNFIATRTEGIVKEVKNPDEQVYSEVEFLT